MKSGWELDALIAEKIMGWEDNTQDPKKPGMWGIMDYYADGKPALVPNFPCYSSNIEYAWEVVEKLRDMGYSIDISAYPKNREWLEPPYEGCPAPEWKLVPTQLFYQCRVASQDPDLGFWISIVDECSAESPAHAICLSALKVLGL